MSVELKVFGGAYFPKDKALKKHPDLKPLATAVNAATKAIAEAVIFGKLAAEHPEHIDDFFKVKIWEHREGLPCPELDVFSPEFFDTVAIWNVNVGEPAAAPQPESEEKTEWEDNKAEEVIKTVAQLDQASRAACLALFGPVPGITTAQYGQIVDLKNDDEPSFARELAEALSKETRSLALAPERQEQLLAWVRENTKDSAQWPDIKKQIAKWIDTPVDKRPQAAPVNEENRTETGSTLGGGNKTDRSPDLAHNLSTLKIEVAVAILSTFDEIDIYSIPNKFFIPAKAMAEAEQDTRFTAWWKKLRGTPGILDYSRAAIIALIKSAQEDLWMDPVALREYINRELVESDHEHPDQKTVDTACRPKPRANLQEIENDEAKPPVPSETLPPAVCPGKAAQLDKELNEAFAKDPTPEKQAGDQPRVENLGGGVFSVESLMSGNNDIHPALTEREAAIKALVEKTLAGKTNCFSEEEAEELVSNTGHDSSHLTMMIMTDIFALENGETPEIIDDYDIEYLAWSALEEWSDNPETRLDYLTRVLEEYRQEGAKETPAAVVLPPPEVNANPEEQRPASVAALSTCAITYHQQLTAAALQGLCSNPAYCNQYDDLPGMAVWLASSVISQQEIAE
ncbi:exodeoxyribonuclease VIII [Enterobacter cancerogenus]|uniref:exodeoxyribonuclease VIII n=1 Tax=Enterobacter cancerogenus TaxID=69218 RepID=UPI001CA41B7E|nr:exodeoxyribonuclease VIII [Enterobacter cancerogenus]QZY35121.1 exodeoxyribonuclease VIII [Enterobacter cancerogenus]